VKKIKSENVSVVLVGDYNSRPESSVYRLVKHQLPMDEEAIK
jgi:endonuclease/exonuclease/phosphatase family metal-dependent hydrolase